MAQKIIHPRLGSRARSLPEIVVGTGFGAGGVPEGDVIGAAPVGPVDGSMADAELSEKRIRMPRSVR